MRSFFDFNLVNQADLCIFLCTRGFLAANVLTILYFWRQRFGQQLYTKR